MRVTCENVFTAISDNKIEVVSFDVFDTLLLRPFWEPTDLFYFLDCEAARLLSAQDIIPFTDYRKDAEKKARALAADRGSEDVTLREIYNILLEDDVLPKDVIEALMKEELALEERFCYLRQSAKGLMDYAVSAGKRIVAISDMYLPAVFIEKLLEKNGLPKLEKVFVSCEHGLTKRTGRLYNYVLNTLGIQREQMIHIGDNLVSDVKVPEKLGIKAFPYYRTIDLLSGRIPKVCAGKAFQYAYKQLRSPFPNSHSLDKLGIRCMLAVAANRVYDDPYRDFNKGGGYAGDELLFGNLALGMYSMAQALWVDRLASKASYDKVLFFARDGFLPYKGFCLLQELRKKETACYVRISRKAILPLILSSEKRLLTASSFANYKTHSPKSLTKLLMPALRDSTSAELEKQMGDKWTMGFSSKTELMQYLKMLYFSYVDQEKMEEIASGFTKYFAPLFSGNVLTYDVGYNIKNETMLHSFFPDAYITAAFMHSTDDLPLIRSQLSNIQIEQFYSSAPYVSWVPRELFLTETAPSCFGYSSDGEPIFEDSERPVDLIFEQQKQAIAYMKQFVDLFREDALRLPIEPADACLPMEAFLHSPTEKDRKWLSSLNADNSADSGLRTVECQKYWRKLCTDYWIAQRHLSKAERNFVRFWLLLQTDRPALRKAFLKRIPEHIRVRIFSKER